MKTFFKLAAISFLLTAIAFSNVNAQNVTVAGSTGADGNYPSLTGAGGAFAALNANLQTGTEIITIRITNNTAETGANSLNAGLWLSVNIAPSGGAWTCSGAPAAGTPLINFNGADNVTIDGLNTGGNSLTISNTTVGTTAGTCTIRFIADASNNTITNCSIRGSSTSTLATAAGTIVFSTGTTTGNDNNTISNCDIGPAGANLPSKAIMSLGSASATLPLANSGNLITNNNIFDYFLPGSSTAGINIVTGNDNWTISNNRLYETATRTFTTTALRFSGITLNQSTANALGSFTVTGNIIGFASSTQTGTMTITGSSNEFRGIDAASVSTTVVTNIQGNTISGIDQTSSRASTGSTSAAFIGIMAGTTDGLINIGNTTGNNIGSLNGSSTIVIRASSTTANTSPSVGIYNFSLRACNVSNNNIGSVTIMQAGGVGTTVGFRGILVVTDVALAAIINDNTVANIDDQITGAYAVYGIQCAFANATMINNTVRDMKGRGNTLNIITMGGILCSQSTGANLLEKNDVYNLQGTVIGANTGAVYAYSLSFPSQGNIVRQNYAYAIEAVTTIIGYQCWGIVRSGAGGCDVYNNMVTVGLKADGSSITAPLSIMGIFDGTTVGPNNYWYNSVYITGTGVTAGAANSFGMFVSGTATGLKDVRNNIFWNDRSNAVSSALANHYAITYPGVAPNPPGITSDYNDLVATGTDGNVGLYNALPQLTLANWQAATNLDANSASVTVSFLMPSAGDLHLTGASIGDESLIATPIGITVDIDKNPRDATYPYMGAHEPAQALPVELASFSSSVNRRNVTLNWTTSRETNNQTFMIERSFEGVWSTAGSVAGSGTTNENRSYTFTDKALNNGTYNYRLKQIDYNGNFEYFNLSNEVNVGVPTQYALSQNYPNPFNPSTKINYDLPFDSKVSILLYDISGRVVSNLVNETKKAGYYTINFNGSNLASGTYFYKLTAEGSGNNFVSTKKMVLVK